MADQNVEALVGQDLENFKQAFTGAKEAAVKGLESVSGYPAFKQYVERLTPDQFTLLASEMLRKGKTRLLEAATQIRQVKA